MKILLSTLYSEEYDAKFEEIGIASIAAYMREKNYPVLLMGSTYENIDYDKIEEFKPDVLGVSVYARTKDISYQFIDELKKRFPSLIICLGGYLVTTHDKEILNENLNIDYIVRGEGEVPFYNLLENIKKGTPEETLSVTYRKGDEIIRNKLLAEYDDLNSYPMPSRDYLLDHKLTTATCFFSRGCTAKCHFCSTPNYWKKWRGRDVDHITEEIKYLDSLGVRYLLIQDCSFENPGSNYKRVYEVARAIKSLDLDMRYFIALRAEFSRRMDDALIKELKDSGLFLVNIGIEAGNTHDLRLYRKPAKIEDNQRILDLLKQNDIACRMGFMNFNPYTSFDTLKDNVTFLTKNNQTWKAWHLFSHYMAFHGTRLYDKVEADGYLLEDQFDKKTYSFVDERVGQLFHYLDGHLQKLLNLEELNKEVHLLDSLYVLIYEFYSKFKEDVEVVKSLEIDYNENFATLSHTNASWFGDLVDYFESGENDYQVADEMVFDTLTQGNATRVFEQAHTIKYDILASLYQNPKYEKWLTNSFYTYMVN